MNNNRQDGSEGPINGLQETALVLVRDQARPRAYPTLLHCLWNLIMDIPIQFPWHRRVFPPRLSDLSMAEPFTDWPFFWPLSWSFPWMRPSIMRWFSWSDNGHSEVTQKNSMTKQSSVKCLLKFGSTYVNDHLHVFPISGDRYDL